MISSAMLTAQQLLLYSSSITTPKYLVIISDGQ